MTLSEITAAICDYTQNFEQDFVANIPVFLQQSEQRIYNSVQFPSLRKSVVGATVADDAYFAMPSDFLAVYSLAVIDATGSYEYLLNKDVNFIRQAYPKPTDTALPKYYALFGPQAVSVNELTLLLGPTPDAVYATELHYYHYPESITVAASGRTWLGDNFDSVLLYGGLVEAIAFMKGEADLVTLYNTKFNEALALAKRLGDGLEKQDQYRNGQTRVKVM